MPEDLSYESYLRQRGVEQGAPPGPPEPQGEEAPGGSPDLSYERYKAETKSGTAPDLGPKAPEAPADLSYGGYLKATGRQPVPEAGPEGLFKALDEGEEQQRQQQPVSPHAGSGWFQLLSNSLQRGIGGLQEIPDTLSAMMSEAGGDKEEADRLMHSVEASHRALPQAEWDLSKIHDLGDFGYWLTERMGENAPALIAMLGTGGAAGMLSVLGRSGLSLASQAAIRAAAIRAGTMAAAAPLSVAGVAQEQYGATGSTQPGLSTATGVAGAWLQTYLPAKLLGHELGPGFWNSVGHGALVGGAFGTAQEALNIMARKYTDPSYSFFSQGADRVGWGWRLFESGATNVALGAALGPLGRSRGGKPPDTSPFAAEPEVPGQEPGFRGEVPPEGGPPGGGAPPAAGKERYAIYDADNNLLGASNDLKEMETAAEQHSAKGPVTLIDLPGNLEKEITPEGHGEWKEEAFAADTRRLEEAQAAQPEAKGRPGETPEQTALYDRHTKLLQDLWNTDENSPEYQKLLAQFDEVDQEIQQKFPKRPAGTTLHQMQPMHLGGPPRVELQARPPREPAEAPKEATGATAPEPGPITRFRNWLTQTPISPDRNLVESTMPANGDAFGAGPLIRDTVEKMYDQEKQLEWLEANTPRYAVEDPRYPSGYLPRLLTDTDLEKMSIDHPQSAELKTWEIDQGSLQMAGVSADVFDLPPAGDSRIWFLPGTTPAEQAVLLSEYVKLQAAAEGRRAMSNASRAHEVMARGGSEAHQVVGLEHVYEQLVNRGLRVLPSRGSSFYYDGSFQGRRALVTETGRTRQVTMMDPDTGAMRTLAGFQEMPEYRGEAIQNLQGWKHAVPMAFDLNKFKPGDIMGLPLQSPSDRAEPRHYGFTFRKDVSPAEQAAIWQRAVELMRREDYETNPTVFAEWRDLMNQGLMRDPKLPSSWVLTRMRLTLDKLTPGIYRYENKANVRDPDFGIPIKESMVETEGAFMPSHYEGPAKAIQFAVAKALPAVDGILDHFGVKNDDGTPARLEVKIKPGGDDWMRDQTGTTSDTIYNAGDAVIDQGTINLYVAGIMSQRTLKVSTTNPLHSVLSVLMHEVGHFMTLRMISRAPPELQKMFRYAYEKSLLESRMNPRAAELRVAVDRMPGDNPGAMMDMKYYLTYPEWLAEQFRRWSMSNAEPRTLLERQFKTYAKDMETFYSAWEKAFPGTAAARDLMEPSYHFSAAMHYYRMYGDRSAGSLAKQLAASLSLSQMPTDVLSHSMGNDVLRKGPLQAMREMERMFPPGVRTVLNTWLNPRYGTSPDGVPGRTVAPRPGLWNHPLIELALGALPRAADVPFSRQFFAHELIHVHRMMGLIHETEWSTLVGAAKAAGIQVEAGERQSLRNRVHEYGEQMGWDQATRDRAFENAHQEEMVAQYVEKFANNEPLGQHPGLSLAKRILDFTYRIRDLLKLQGLHAREHVLERFFTGEMAQRPQRAYENSIIREMEKSPPIQPQSIKTVEGLPHIAVATQEVNLGPNSPLRHIFKFYDNAAGKVRGARDLATAKLLGWVTLEAEDRGLHVSYIKSSGDRFFMMKTMLDHVERELGDSVLPASEFTDAGYKMARIQYREELKHYTWVDAIKRWVSPNFIRDNLTIAMESGSKIEQQFWKNLYEKVPKETWQNPILNQMFMLPREWMRDEVQGSIGAAGRESDQARFQQSLGSTPAAGTDPFTAAGDRASQISQAENARTLGVTFSQSAPRLPLMEMRQIADWARRGTERVEGYREGPEVRGDLTGTIAEADRIGWFTKRWWDILQLLWNNEHIEGLRTYVGGIKLWQRMVSHWQTRADESVRAWNQLPIDRRDAVGRVLFWSAEQQYRTPNEVLNNVRRQPTAAELDGQMRREGFNVQERALYDRIRGDFLDYLNEAQRQTIVLTTNRITDPAARAAAIGRIITEYNELRAKPYFPMTRFGRWTVTVRDLGHPDQPIIGSYAYDTRGMRDRALEDIRTAFPGQRITYGTVPDTVGEFMGLPGPLLREIKTKLPGLTPAQLTWIEEFEHLHAPDHTFRRRWLPQSDMPGHSMDAMRAYSSFFISGANYLARLVHTPILEDGIREIRDTLTNDNLANTAKRQEILKYVTDHYRYMSESGRDWGKTKAFISLWQLGFSPAAAFTNLMQTPTTTLPHLMGAHGNVAGARYVSRAISTRDAQMPGNWAQARVEFQREGLLDVGQAADLAMYAEGPNLLKSLAGNRAELIWRELSHRGMWLFQNMEQANRITAAKAAWMAAMENPNHARVAEVQQLYPREMGDLQTSGLTTREAAAFLYAKDVLEKTQFVFAKWNRPPFLRSQLAQVALIFFKYTQNMIELYRLTPGMVQMALIQAALFGVAGLPGAEDMNQVMKSAGHLGVWLLRKFGINYFGKDFDLLDKAREYTRQLTEGTMFDKTGPDLLLHGISRYGFGLGLLPEGMGIGQFDASANGSLGRVVPGLQEGLKQLTIGDYKTGVSDVVGRAAGAGYGWLFTLLKYMSEDPGTFDSKTWEGLLPRAGRQVARTYRFATEGLTTRQGGRLVKFDMTDPEDLGALAAQLAGYTPTKVAEMMDVQKDLIERQMLLKMEKTMLYGQLYKAVDGRDPRVITDVMKAIEDYNKQVGPEDPTQVIKPEGLRASIQRRAQQRAMQSALQQPGAVNKATIPMYQKILENYPGVVDRRRVQ